MKINFTKKEFEILINSLYISNWVLHAHGVGEGNEKKEYRELEQKIFSYAKEFGLDELVMFEQKYQEFFPTRKLEDGPAREFIEEFENDSFWDELVNRLADRDFIRKYGKEKIAEMSGYDRLEKIGEFEEKYADEIDENGLKNIEVKGIDL